jgi:hypothetical protein
VVFPVRIWVPPLLKVLLHREGPRVYRRLLIEVGCSVTLPYWVAHQRLHETGEYSSFVEVGDDVHFPPWLGKVKRTRRVQGRRRLWSERYGFGIGGGDAGEVP